MFEDKSIAKYFIKNPYILILGIDKYHSKVSHYIPGTLIDIARIQKWLKDKNIYNYNSNSINVIKPNENTKHINETDFIKWLANACTEISASFHPKFNQGKQPFDGLLFYISCHAGINKS